MHFGQDEEEKEKTFWSVVLIWSIVVVVVFFTSTSPVKKIIFFLHTTHHIENGRYPSPYRFRKNVRTSSGNRNVLVKCSNWYKTHTFLRIS